MLLRKVPGGLALSVTLMGTIMAATTGIIGASVVMMTLLALPVMMRRNYDPSLATGTIAASGTLGILIPPSIMLVLMSDLLSVSVGNLFLAAIIPGLLLASLYTLYIFVRCQINPSLAPPLPEGEAVHGMDLVKMMLRSFPAAGLPDCSGFGIDLCRVCHPDRGRRCWRGWCDFPGPVQGTSEMAGP